MGLRWPLTFANTIVFGDADDVLSKLYCRESNKHGAEKAAERAVGFQVPLHYPRYKKQDYEKMEEWKVDMILKEYGIVNFAGTLDEKRKFAMGAFLWPDQL